MSAVLLQYTAVFNVKTVSSVNPENYNYELHKFFSSFQFE